MALTISRRSCCIFAIPNPARWARHADSIGSISDQRASDRSVRYARRGVFTRLLYQSNIHNGGTSAVSSLPRSYQIMPKRGRDALLVGGLEDRPASIVATDGTVTDGPNPDFISGI